MLSSASPVLPRGSVYPCRAIFSDVSIRVDSLVADSAFLHIKLAMRPQISEIKYSGVKKSEREDLEQKLGLIKDYQVTPNLINRTKLLTRRYFDEQGYKNADIEILQKDDISHPGNQHR